MLHVSFGRRPLDLSLHYLPPQSPLTWHSVRANSLPHGGKHPFQTSHRQTNPYPADTRPPKPSIPSHNSSVVQQNPLTTPNTTSIPAGYLLDRLAKAGSRLPPPASIEPKELPLLSRLIIIRYTDRCGQRRIPQFFMLLAAQLPNTLWVANEFCWDTEVGLE